MKTETKEYFVIVDENDKVIGKEERSIAFQKRLIFRGLRIIVKNEKGEYLFLKRTKEKKMFPDCWEIGVGGGLTYGEEPIDAAKREVSEELGIKNPQLTYINKRYIENEKERLFTYIFLTGHTRRDGQFVLQESEVADTAFVSKENLDEFLKDKKVHYPSVDMFKEMLKEGTI
ncbi:MAG: NUDIX domain-containing protein [Nanoarchaeota archaeon]|nr:NUDIX domain-containing protein [Nanoarchaeota archaeon]